MPSNRLARLLATKAIGRRRRPVGQANSAIPPTGRCHRPMDNADPTAPATGTEDAADRTTASMVTSRCRHPRDNADPVASAAECPPAV
jgi:hypothetical protein